MAAVDSPFDTTDNNKTEMRDVYNKNDEAEQQLQQVVGEDFHYNLDDVIEHIGVGPFQVKVLIVVGLMWIGDASETMILSIISPILRCKWNLSSKQEACITTVVFLGLCVGSAVFGTVGDKLGRKRGLYASCVVLVVFGAACAAAPSYPWLLVLRFLAGVGMGGIPQACTMVAETFPVAQRGIYLVKIFI